MFERALARVKSCPAGIISVTREVKRTTVTIDDTRCIRCYCCQELCPHNAIKLKEPLLGRVFFSFRKE